MASAEAATKPTAEASTWRRWRFSLRGLFAAITVCALILFSAVQFGPVAAARHAAIGLGIALVLLALRGRSLKRALAAGALAAAGFIPTILVANAPFSEREAICLECGLSRHVSTVCGRTTKDEIVPTEASRWAAPLVPAGHTHRWSFCSSQSRPHWFTSAYMACGGPREGAFMAWQLAHLGDEAGGQQALREYHAILAGNSTKPLAIHRQEVEAAINAALQARR